MMLLLVNILTACGNGSQLAAQFAAPADSIQMATFTPDPTLSATATGATNKICLPTIDDGLSPTYKPNAPIRSSVGHGHVLTGEVLSSLDCSPIANAQLEFWPEYLNRGHPDEARVTLFTDNAGRYRFECDLPEHIHMRISATGYRTLAQNSYHPEGRAARPRSGFSGGDPISAQPDIGSAARVQRT
jgi:protocatechuate 3,4-dioxygenase beta subunit